MRHFFRIFAVLTLAFGLMASPCFAEGASHYVSPEELPPQLLPPPPAESGDIWRGQIDAVLSAQADLGGGDVQAIRDEQQLKVELVAETLGPDFTRDRYPQIYAVLDNVLSDCEAIGSADKQYWHTRRPYLTDSDVKILVDRIDESPSYPSGHTAGSRVLAETLGLIFPDRLADLRARANEIAWHRVQAGAHYPVDIEGGRLLAMLVMGGMMKSAAFQIDLAAARGEIVRQ